MRNSFVYIVASSKNAKLYLGVTRDILSRAWQHRNEYLAGYSTKHKCHRLVWYETHDDIREAIRREKQMKKWRRAWKIELIEKTNPGWRDLSGDLERGLLE